MVASGCASAVDAIVFDTYVLTAAANGKTISIFEGQQLLPTQEITVSSEIHAVAFCPVDAQLAVVSTNHIFLLTATFCPHLRESLCPLRWSLACRFDTSHKTYAVAWSSTGKKLFTGGEALQVWDLPGLTFGASRHNYPTGAYWTYRTATEITKIVVSPDDRCVATTSRSSRAVKVFFMADIDEEINNSNNNNNNNNNNANNNNNSDTPSVGTTPASKGEEDRSPLLVLLPHRRHVTCMAWRGTSAGGIQSRNLSFDKTNNHSNPICNRGVEDHVSLWAPPDCTRTNLLLTVCASGHLRIWRESEIGVGMTMACVFSVPAYAKCGLEIDKGVEVASWVLPPPRQPEQNEKRTTNVDGDVLGSILGLTKGCNLVLGWQVIGSKGSCASIRLSDPVCWPALNAFDQPILNSVEDVCNTPAVHCRALFTLQCEHVSMCGGVGGASPHQGTLVSILDAAMSRVPTSSLRGENLLMIALDGNGRLVSLSQSEHGVVSNVATTAPSSSNNNAASTAATSTSANGNRQSKCNDSDCADAEASVAVTEWSAQGVKMHGHSHPIRRMCLGENSISPIAASLDESGVLLLWQVPAQMLTSASLHLHQVGMINPVDRGDGSVVRIREISWGGNGDVLWTLNEKGEILPFAVDASAEDQGPFSSISISTGPVITTPAVTLSTICVLRGSRLLGGGVRQIIAGLSSVDGSDAHQQLSIFSIQMMQGVWSRDADGEDTARSEMNDVSINMTQVAIHSDSESHSRATTCTCITSPPLDWSSSGAASRCFTDGAAFFTGHSDGAVALWVVHKDSSTAPWIARVTAVFGGSSSANLGPVLSLSAASICRVAVVHLRQPFVTSLWECESFGFGFMLEGQIRLDQAVTPPVAAETHRMSFDLDRTPMKRFSIVGNESQVNPSPPHPLTSAGSFSSSFSQNLPPSLASSGITSLEWLQLADGELILAMGGRGGVAIFAVGDEEHKEGAEYSWSCLQTSAALSISSLAWLPNGHVLISQESALHILPTVLPPSLSRRPNLRFPVHSGGVFIGGHPAPLLWQQPPAPHHPAVLEAHWEAGDEVGVEKTIRNLYKSVSRYLEKKRGGDVEKKTDNIWAKFEEAESEAEASAKATLRKAKKISFGGGGGGGGGGSRRGSLGSVHSEKPDDDNNSDIGDEFDDDLAFHQHREPWPEGTVKMEADALRLDFEHGGPFDSILSLFNQASSSSSKGEEIDVTMDLNGPNTVISEESAASVNESALSLLSESTVDELLAHQSLGNLEDSVSSGGEIARDEICRRLLTKLDTVEDIQGVGADQMTRLKAFVYALSECWNKPREKLDIPSRRFLFAVLRRRHILQIAADKKKKKQEAEAEESGLAGFSTPSSGGAAPAPESFAVKVSTSEMVWAMLSENQEAILDEAIGNSNPSWEQVASLGIPLWLNSNARLRQLAEKVAKGQFLKSKDSVDAALTYLCLGRKSTLIALLKAHRQEKLSTFLANNFEEDRWKTAAVKNAYVLLGQHRYELAACFFVLGGLLRDAVQICHQRLNDPMLALFVARLVEGQDGGTEHAALLQTFVQRNARGVVANKGDGSNGGAGEGFDDSAINGDLIGNTGEEEEGPSSLPQAASTADGSSSSSSSPGHISPFFGVMALWMLRKFVDSIEHLSTSVARISHPGHAAVIHSYMMSLPILKRQEKSENRPIQPEPQLLWLLSQHRHAASLALHRGQLFLALREAGFAHQTQLKLQALSSSSAEHSSIKIHQSVSLSVLLFRIFSAIAAHLVARQPRQSSATAVISHVASAQEIVDVCRRVNLTGFDRAVMRCCIEATHTHAVYFLSCSIKNFSSLFFLLRISSFAAAQLLPSLCLPDPEEDNTNNNNNPHSTKADDLLLARSIKAGLLRFASGSALLLSLNDSSVDPSTSAENGNASTTESQQRKTSSASIGSGEVLSLTLPLPSQSGAFSDHSSSNASPLAESVRLYLERTGRWEVGGGVLVSLFVAALGGSGYGGEGMIGSAANYIDWGLIKAVLTNADVGGGLWGGSWGWGKMNALASASRGFQFINQLRKTPTSATPSPRSLRIEGPPRRRRRSLPSPPLLDGAQQAAAAAAAATSWAEMEQHEIEWTMTALVKLMAFRRLHTLLNEHRAAALFEKSHPGAALSVSINGAAAVISRQRQRILAGPPRPGLSHHPPLTVRLLLLALETLGKSSAYASSPIHAVWDHLSRLSDCRHECELLLIHAVSNPPPPPLGAAAENSNYRFSLGQELAKIKGEPVRSVCVRAGDVCEQLIVAATSRATHEICAPISADPIGEHEDKGEENTPDTFDALKARSVAFADDWTDFFRLSDFWTSSAAQGAFKSSMIDKLGAIAVAAHPTLPLYVSGGSDPRLMVYSFGVPRPSFWYTWPESTPPIYRIRFSANAATFGAVNGQGGLGIWSFSPAPLQREPLLSFSPHSRRSHDLAFIGGGGYTFASVGEGEGADLCVWDVLSPPLSRRIAALPLFGESGGKSVCFIPQSSCLVAGGRGGEVSVVDVRTWKVLHSTTNAHKGSTKCITPSPCGSLFFSGGREGDIKVWEVDSFDIIHTWKNVHSRPGSVAPLGLQGTLDLFVDENSVVSCGSDGRVVRHAYGAGDGVGGVRGRLRRSFALFADESPNTEC